MGRKRVASGSCTVEVIRADAGEIQMLTIVFLMFVGLFAIAGTFISIEAKRRSVRSGAGGASPRNDKPAIGRATPGND